MYWDVTALTRMGSIVKRSIKASRAEAVAQIKDADLDLISIYPDYKKYVLGIFSQDRFSNESLSVFFKDLSRGLKSGLSIQEVIALLNEQTTDPLLKKTLEKLTLSIIDGRSFRESFENTKVFPSIVLNALDAAERSGHMTEVTLILSEYFSFMNDSKTRLVKSLIYPACVFIALTVASVVISVKLVPQLSTILPLQDQDTLQAKFITGYASLIRSCGWGIVIALIAAIGFTLKWWEQKKDWLMVYLLKVPLLSDVIKENWFVLIFLNLYVYQKSGINIVAALTNIYSNGQDPLTRRLIVVRERVIHGQTLGDAFKADDFFPPYIYMNIRKGETTGNLYQYCHEIFRYYEQRTRSSIDTLIGLVNPVLLGMAVAYLGLIISCFILPLYSSMGAAGRF